MKRNWKILFLFCISFFSFSANAQEMIPDTIIVQQEWNDKNGYNILNIIVGAACNPARDDKPQDAHETSIQVHLKNEKYTLSIAYYDDNYQSEMIFFYEGGIHYQNIRGIRAVFIPFFYCHNYNLSLKLSYVILYNNHSYLYHFDYECCEGDENAGCALNNENLDEKFKNMYKPLRKKIEKYLTSSYRTWKDLSPGLIVEKLNKTVK